MLVVPGLAAAELRRMGDLVFDLPADYEAAQLSVNDREGLVVRPADWLDRDADTFTHVHLTAAAPVAGDVKAWAAGFLGGHLDSDERAEVAAWEQTTPQAGADTYVTLLRVVDADDGDEQGHLMAAVYVRAGRGTAVYVEGDDRAELERQAADLQRLTDGVRHADDVPPIEGPATPGPYDGFHWGNALYYTFGGMQVSERGLTFRRDGGAYDGIPPGGIHDFDYDALARTHTHSVGRYAVAPGPEHHVVTIRWADGAVETIEGDAARPTSDGSHTLYPARTLPDGFTFDGKYDHLTYVPNADFANPGGVAAGSALEFRRDGTFAREGFVSATGANHAFVNNSAGHGRYAHRGGDLQLTYADGRVVHWPMWVLDGEDGPAALDQRRDGRRRPAPAGRQPARHAGARQPARWVGLRQPARSLSSPSDDPSGHGLRPAGSWLRRGARTCVRSGRARPPCGPARSSPPS